METGALDDLDGTGSTEVFAGAAFDVAVDFLDDVCKGLKAKGSSSSSLKSISMTGGGVLILGGVGARASMGFFSWLGLSLLTNTDGILPTAPLVAVLLGVVPLLLLGVLRLDPSVTVLCGEFLGALVRAAVNRDLICLLG